jgi:hypothetical protein
MLKKIKEFIRIKSAQLNRIEEIQKSNVTDLKNPKINLGQIQSYLNNQKQEISSLHEVEFQVFSQWGDDGIIQYLINKIHIPNKTFIEFGVENYKESNTRFLLINNNWSGYVIDGSQENINFIKNDSISFAYELYANASFITAENINQLLQKPKFDPEVGILSIDIDGNDYWVWKAIDCLNPIIIIAEYNSLFGKNTAWTVPYDPHFIRSEKHWSMVYYGASLKALQLLAEEKGYYFIGCNSNGNNSYFIRKDKIGDFKILSVTEGYVFSKFREILINGERPSGEDRVKVIEGLDVIDIESGTTIKINSSLINY